MNIAPATRVWGGGRSKNIKYFVKSTLFLAILRPFKAKYPYFFFGLASLAAKTKYVFAYKMYTRYCEVLG